jgi:UDPglucose--hexose-1-phosphate uridylyltransferase
MDYKFIHDTISGKWVISAPKRAKRPNTQDHKSSFCPFCPGRETQEKELYRVGGKDQDQNWLIRVLPNKYPFAPIHEIIVHSQDHRKNFDELPLSQVELIIDTFKNRFLTYQSEGNVYIFHNHGEAGGESLIHPHSQLVVIPDNMTSEIPPLHRVEEGKSYQETNEFLLHCPSTSQWPDEVWIIPKKEEEVFSGITAQSSQDLAFVVARLIQIFDLRHGHNFPFNFYIYPGRNWYLRLIPRVKILGGFELGTNIFVNTQDPDESISFIKEHFEKPDFERIKKEHQAEYRRSV